MHFLSYVRDPLTTLLSLVLLAVFYSGHALAYSVRVVDSSQWAMIAVPANPSEGDTLEALFGDDLPVDRYGPSGQWLMYGYDSAAGQYNLVALDEPLSANKGYWLFQRTGESVTLDIPSTVAASSGSTMDGCISGRQCVSVPLTGTDGVAAWHLVGYSADSPIRFGDTRFVTASGACSAGCTPTQARAQNVVDDVMYRLNNAGDNYEVIDEDTLLQPWDGYWLLGLSGAVSPSWVIPVGTQVVDSDNDGVPDSDDAFPTDPTETRDSDNDGVGDNADAFPLNASETLDSDSDGVGDNADAFPLNSSESKDSDNDGVGDNADAFPDDPAESADSDGDGVGDNADVGEALVVNNGQVLTMSSPLEGQLSWQQVSGPLVEWLDQEGTEVTFIAPDVSEVTELEIVLLNGTAQDRIAVRVEPCVTEDDQLFGDCIAPGFGSWLSFESGETTGPFFHRQGQGDYHVQWKSVDTEDLQRGKVIEVTWSANDPAHLIDARGWFGLAMPAKAATEGADLTDYADGALSFDMRMVYHDSPNQAAGFITKMECVFPCRSAEIPIPNAHTSYEWKTYTYPVRQFTSTGLDLSKVNHILVIQPDWFQQNQRVVIQLDNVRLSKQYEPPAPAEGCLAAGNVTYTLRQESNPTADQQEAYRLITSAMDRAVENYNCYTNLSRHLSVQYAPWVATADGNVNGNIRFGSRASMHFVTAMHEIAHTFGAGGSAEFRALVSNRKFQGANALAQLREISGNPADELNSDGVHFWPHGLNYILEARSQQDLINHCLMVEAIYRDLSTL